MILLVDVSPSLKSITIYLRKKKKKAWIPSLFFSSIHFSSILDTHTLFLKPESYQPKEIAVTATAAIARSARLSKHRETEQTGSGEQAAVAVTAPPGPSV